MKRTIILLTVIGALIAGWSGVWYFIEGKVVETADRLTERLAQKGQQIECADRAVGGYPFRISFDCSSVSYFNERTGVAFNAGSLKSGAQAYQPGKAVVELASPARLVMPDGQSFSTRWDSMRSSVAANLDGLDRFSAVGVALDVEPDGRPQDRIELGELQVHGLRGVGETVRFAVRTKRVSDAQNRWPMFDANVLIAIEGVYSELLRRPDLLSLARRDGINGEVEAIEYRPDGGGELAIAGPIQISPTGIVSGKFELKITDAPTLLTSLEKGLPGYQKELEQFGSAIRLLGGVLKGREIEVPVSVNNGSVMLGFIKVAELPPVY